MNNELTPKTSRHFNRKTLLGLTTIVLIAGGLLTALLLVKQPQEVRQRAAGPVCPVNGASCSWAASTGATSYHYKVVEVGTNTTLVEGNTGGTSTTFTSAPGKTYTCTVTAANVCGSSAPATGTSTCQLTQTPTPPVTHTPTPSPSSTPTPTPSTTPAPTPISCNSSCITNSDCSSFQGSVTLSCISGQCRNTVCSTDQTCYCGSPTPTPTLTPTATATPAETITPTEILPSNETPTATPVIPVTGPDPLLMNAGIMGIGIFIVGALVFIL